MITAMTVRIDTDKYLTYYILRNIWSRILAQPEYDGVALRIVEDIMDSLFPIDMYLQQLILDIGAWDRHQSVPESKVTV
jgi:hypothetical protein